MSMTLGELEFSSAIFFKTFQAHTVWGFSYSVEFSAKISDHPL